MQEFKPRTAVSRGLITGAIGLLFLMQAILLFKAFYGGEYTNAIPWDDCSILDLALLRLSRVASSHSLLGLFLKAQDLAPHSPVADIQSMLGYLLSGGGVWGPYLLNSLAPLGVLLAIWPALKRRSTWVAAAVLLLLLAQPITVYSLLNLKADWKGGLFAAGSVFMFFEALETGEAASWRTASALLGAAVLCKLTAFYVPLIALALLGLFYLAAILQERSPEPSSTSIFDNLNALIARLLARWREIVIDVALVVGPYGLFFLYGSHSHFNTLRYIRQALSSTWSDGLSWEGRAAFYGPQTNPAWGVAGWILPAAILLSLLAAWRWRRPRLLQPLWIGLLAAGLFFVPLVYAKTSNIEFGATFNGVCVGLALTMFTRLGSLSRASAVAALLLAAGTALMTPLESYRPPLTATDDADQVQVKHIYEAVLDKMASLRKTPDIAINIYYEDNLFPSPNLGMMFFHKTGHRLSGYRVEHLQADPEEAARAAAADFSIVLIPDAAHLMAGYHPWSGDEPTSHQRQAESIVRAGPNTLVGVYPWKNGQLELFQKTR
jgi:Dolichyl-phosphate-mannose-protein mannosyltransferase